MWIVYLASQALIDAVIYLGKPLEPVLWYHAIHFFPALIFVGLSYSSWLNRRPKATTACMILILSIMPILLNPLFDLKLPQAPLANLEGMVLRQLPVLMIGLVLVAWHYRLSVIVVYTLAISVFELATVAILNRLEGPRVVSFAFIILIRTVCFLVVGIFINKLISDLRAQRESLKSANQQLTHYASALENLTISRERNRMSRELHDTVIHTLSGLSVQLETTKAYLAIEPKTAQNLLDQALDSTRFGLQETRRALKALRASPLEDLGLFQALRQLGRTTAERARLSVEVFLPEDELFCTSDVAQYLYRIAQEAVENVVHHAGARHLTINLSAHDNDVELIIQDDGVGFDPINSSPNGHFGITGMKERAALMGGDLSIASHPGSGTTIRLIIKGCIQ